MATPTFDNATSANGGATAVSSLTFSHTVNSATNGILIVGVSLRNPSSQTVTGVTYNGVAMTLVLNSGGSNAIRSEMWRLLAPATGANNVVVTLSAAAMVSAGAMSYTNVHQTTPLGTAAIANGDSAGPATVNATSATGELVVDALALRGNRTATAGAGQTDRWNNKTTADNDSDARGGGSEEAGATTVTMSWTLSAANPWGIVAVALKPSADVASTPKVIPTLLTLGVG